jgi:hypothetical protein
MSMDMISRPLLEQREIEVFPGKRRKRHRGWEKNRRTVDILPEMYETADELSSCPLPFVENDA